MIHYIFPTTIYTRHNVELLPLAEQLFAKAEPFMQEIRQGFKSTLKEYCPLKAVTPFDPLQLPESSPLINFLENSILEFLNETGYCDYKSTITNMWFNSMEPTSYHTEHNHYGYTFSGTYYIACPEGSDKVAFHANTEYCYQSLKHIKTYNESNTHTWHMPVKEGMLVIFPAHLKHSVPPLEFSGLRRCIAFDAVCQPTYGVSSHE
jgi:uncharacterized protein (TIGR02466 family)